MKRFGSVLSCAVACLFGMLMSACWHTMPAGTPHRSAMGIPERRTFEAEKIVRFAEGSSHLFHASDGYANGAPFDCVWSSNCAQISDGFLRLSLIEEKHRAWGREYDYAGGEYRSHASYSYGFFSVRMKAAKCAGVISSFFTYTNRAGWDEIDIEFLGNDTTKIQLNYYTQGVGGHEYIYKLGFDSAEDFHEYAFDWSEEAITWYVDGVAVYRATKDIPKNSMQIMMNVWNTAGVDRWAGRLDADMVPVSALYEWIGYFAAN